MYSIGTEVPFCGKITHVKRESLSYVVEDEHGVRTVLSHKDVYKLIND